MCFCASLKASSTWKKINEQSFFTKSTNGDTYIFKEVFAFSFVENLSWNNVRFNCGIIL